MKLLILKSVCIVLIILTLFASVTGCDFVTNFINKDNSNSANNTSDKTDADTNQKTGLESGFSVSSGDECSSFYGAYKSDKTEFDINNVTLDFYYGIYFLGSEEYEREHGYSFPSFDLYFVDRKGENKIFIRHVEENFISEKYRCKLIYDENWNVTKIKYNYFETLTIPKEMFTKEVGMIYFSVYSANVREYQPKYRATAGATVFYKMEGNKVILTDNAWIYIKKWGGEG